MKERIIARARELGFDAVGVARADEPLGIEHERYLEFVRKDMHGSMAYLADNAEVRRSLCEDSILAGAKSVICLARRYQRPPAAEASDPPLAKLVARYARGHDYHNHLRKKVRALAKFIKRLVPGAAVRVLCDEEPVLERAWAARAGLGFVGKNGLVIVPGQGSFVLLGEVVTSLDLPPDVPMAERCGSCTKCLDACPTSAFEAPFKLDPRRCIAYLTIEDPLGSERDHAIGEHLFGCDDCQTVCPYNRGSAHSPRSTKPFEPLEALSATTLEDIVRFDDAAFSAFARGSPLRRATRVGLAKNAAAVARSIVGRDQPPGALAADAARALAAAAGHPDPRVRNEALDPSIARGDRCAPSPE